MAEETIFTDGFYLNKVHDNAPSFIITSQTIHVERALKWLQENKHLANDKGYINLTGKESREGKRYFIVDTWKPNQNEPRVEPEHTTEAIDPKAEIPF